MFSQRTRAGLAAAKARGVKLGNPELAARQAADAAARDEALRPVLVSMAGQSSRAIAQALTEQSVEPPRGGVWSYQTVLRMMARLGAEGLGLEGIVSKADGCALSQRAVKAVAQVEEPSE